MRLFADAIVSFLFILCSCSYAQNTSSPPSIQPTNAPFIAPTPAPAILPLEETQTLVKFYEELSGASWLIKSGWGSASDPCTWFGVTCGSAEEEEVHVLSISLNHNNLCGELPPLRNLTHLQTLDLSNPNIYLEAGSNIVGGSLDAICFLDQLQVVALTYNNISSSLPACLESLNSVTLLGLDHNSILGTTPPQICSMASLQELHLRANSITGSLPECIGDASALRLIDYTSLTASGSYPGPQSLVGSIPESVCRLKHLESLQLQFCQGVSGSIPSCLGEAQPAFKTASLEGNQLTGSLPASLCNAGNLTFLYLYTNSMSGSLPECLGYSNLEGLQINTNYFTGVSPFC
jgi:Leucine-rich repeat (LRR) protein